MGKQEIQEIPILYENTSTRHWVELAPQTYFKMKLKRKKKELILS